MRLLSFAADGKEWFGAARDDGIITLNDEIGLPQEPWQRCGVQRKMLRPTAGSMTSDFCR
jgi:hypothetical protein